MPKKTPPTSPRGSTVTPHVDRKDAVAVATDSKEQRLTEAEHAAVAPNQAQPHGHEDPNQQVGHVPDGVGVRKQGVN